nr:unnamed protein product [Callosobruchus analis]
MYFTLRFQLAVIRERTFGYAQFKPLFPIISNAKYYAHECTSIEYD